MDPSSALDLSRRRIHLWCPPGADAVRLIEIAGREALSRLYRFRLKLRTDALCPVDLEAWLGSSVRASFQLPDPNWAAVLESDRPPGSRDICGVITRIEHARTDDQYAYYSATLRPKLWTFGLNRRFRIFSEKTTREIVSSVLGDLPLRWCISGEGLPRNYCVQYGESDLRFVSRLLEEDGLFYTFEHAYDDQPEDPAARMERMVIADSVDRLSDDAPAAYAIDTIGGGNRDSMRIRRWRECRTLVPNRVESLDRHFQRPDSPARAEKTSPQLPGDPGWALTEYPSGVTRRFDEVSPSGGRREDELAQLDSAAEADARRRVERLACRRSSYSGAGDVATLEPGMKFRLVRDSVPDREGYYITRIEHRVRLSAATRSGDGGPELRYENRFHCQPESKPFGPPLATSKPRVLGVVPATVVADPDITDDDICVDAYGRVKVQFPWQQPGDDRCETSCWIRVSQFWAGPRWGAFFWPRVGHEVLVSFEHGDPDRPVIIGSVYNRNNMPPLELPTYKLSCGIHSCTHKGNPTENTSCVVFHDARGDEYLQLHSETYQCLTSETKNLKWSSGEEVEFRGHHWLFDGFTGSGGGGSDFTGRDNNAKAGFKTTNGSIDEGLDVPAMLLDMLTSESGTVDFTIGDTLKKCFGRTIETYHGCNVWVGCDPVEFFEYLAENLETRINPHLLSGIVAFLFGAGGQGKTVFGGMHNIQYGTKVDCHRGPTRSIVSPAVGFPLGQFGQGNATPVDAPVAKACQLMVVVMLLFDLMTTLITKAALAHESNDWNRFVTFSKVWSRYLLPRVQGMIEFVETTYGETVELATAAEDAVDDSEDAVERAARATVTTDSAAEDSVEAAEQQAEEAVDSIRNAEEHLEELVEEGDSDEHSDEDSDE